MADPARLIALAEAVADGRPVDWTDEESQTSDSDLELVHQLKLIAGVASTHRSEAWSDEPASSDPLTDIQKSWGSLDIEDLIGRGSFGTVFRAWDRRLARHVALKLLHIDRPGADSDIVEEGRLLAQVRHAHVITVHGADRFDGRAGIWMELVDGRTLQEIVSERGPFGPHEAALIGIDVSSALIAVHRAGLIHGDIKAQNVMREEGGRTLLMDFGAGVERDAPAARRTGTPLYMAPEMLGGGGNTVASDIYALGVLLFYLVTGQYPVRGASTADLLREHERGAGRRLLRDLRPDLPEWFLRVVDRALAADPRARFQSAGELHQTLAEGPQAGRLAGQRSARLYWAAIAMVVLASVAAIATWLRAPGTPTAAVRSVAVLPFINLTGDEAQEYRAAGLTDVLVANLGRLKGIRVIPVAAAARGHDPEVRARQLAGLDVDAILEGSIQRTATRIRVAVRVVQRRPSSGVVLWSEVYEGPATEAFPIQGRIAVDLMRHLGVAPDERARAAVTRYAPSEAVQDAYLRGQFLLTGADRNNLPKARQEFERAIELDPAYAPAHAALGHTFLDMGAYGLLDPIEVRDLARRAANRAFEIDPMLAEAALAMADISFRLEWDWAAADRAYLTAIDLNPSYVYARSRYARYLAAAGRTAEALDEVRRAYALDPLSDETYALVGLIMYYERRYEDAVQHFSARANDSVGRLVGLGRALAELGRYGDAISALERAVVLSGHDSSVHAELGRICARAGDEARARQIVSELTGRRGAPGDYIAPQDLAYIHVALGEHAHALALLERAVGEHAFRLLWLGVDPRVDALRSQVRFQALLQRLGIEGR